MASQGIPLFFHDIPFNKRWEHLKPTIRRLYIDEDKQPKQAAQVMKDHFRFDALDHQYKYHLKKWGITKKIPSKKKDSVIAAIRKRTRDPNLTMIIKYNGEEVDKKKIRRHINAVEKKNKNKEDTLQLNGNVFIHWNLPYRAFKSSSATERSPFSPFGSTPSDISIGSPHSKIFTTAINASSPTMLAIRDKTLNERARLFVTGAHEELMKGMKRREKKKSLGSLSVIIPTANLERYKDRMISSMANTPMLSAGTPRYPTTPSAVTTGYQNVSSPLRLCRWTIHAAIHSQYDRQYHP
ncbi:hypothetical protein BJ875DRAFT_547603 [Amylocarpus encephaloides]|uniref:Clr5 domain-containing protein n=1 Tax=Amylocarpus encephaloides TaxID=45428 RepID=A0A9P7Y7J7_9HELO|nr:hypothetical protein BJ875DRAFT_547603 [Amylocarpus encephaloides]